MNTNKELNREFLYAQSKINCHYKFIKCVSTYYASFADCERSKVANYNKSNAKLFTVWNDIIRHDINSYIIANVWLMTRPHLWSAVLLVFIHNTFSVFVKHKKSLLCMTWICTTLNCKSYNICHIYIYIVIRMSLTYFLQHNSICAALPSVCWTSFFKNDNNNKVVYHFAHEISQRKYTFLKYILKTYNTSQRIYL